MEELYVVILTEEGPEFYDDYHEVCSTSWGESLFKSEEEARKLIDKRTGNVYDERYRIAKLSFLD